MTRLIGFPNPGGCEVLLGLMVVACANVAPGAT
jgi:hypothetical protein